MDWIKKVWGKSDDDVRRMLIVDKARIHETADAKQAFAGKHTNKYTHTHIQVNTN